MGVELFWDISWFLAKAFAIGSLAICCFFVILMLLINCSSVFRKVITKQIEVANKNEHQKELEQNFIRNYLGHRYYAFPESQNPNFQKREVFSFHEQSFSKSDISIPNTK